MTDETALHQYAQRGDPDAFKHLVDRYQGMVYATCLRRLHNVADVEDAVQKTFIRLAQNAAAVHSDLAAWLHRCAVNVTIDMQRAAATRRRHERQAAEQTPVVEKAVDPLPWKEISRHLDEALDELEEQDRRLLVAVYLRGQSQAEVAQEMGVSRPTMSRWVGRAVERLRKRLRLRGIEAPALAAAITGVLASASQAAVPTHVHAELMRIGLSGAGSQSGAVVAEGVMKQTVAVGVSGGGASSGGGSSTHVLIIAALLMMALIGGLIALGVWLMSAGGGLD